MEIRKSSYVNDREQLHNVIVKSFLTVAVEFNLTPENAPSNAAFLPIETLDRISETMDFYVAVEESQIVGCIGIRPDKNPSTFAIEKLCVLPAYRHEKVGSQLLEKAISEIHDRGAKEVTLGIINENKILKTWYEKKGFCEVCLKQFEHLPFTVCIMNLHLQ